MQQIRTFYKSFNLYLSDFFLYKIYFKNGVKSMQKKYQKSLFLEQAIAGIYFQKKRVFSSKKKSFIARVIYLDCVTLILIKLIQKRVKYEMARELGMRSKAHIKCIFFFESE